LKKTDNSTPWSLILLIAGIYMLSAKGHIEISDTDYSLRTARALVEEGTFLIEAPDPDVAKVAPRIVDGKIYSKYGVGLVIILLPLVLLGKGLALIPGVSENLVTGFLVSFYNIPFAIGVLWFLYGICQNLGMKENRARLVVATTGIATMCWKYTVTDYSQITQCFFLMGTLYFLIRGKEKDTMWASAFFAGLIIMKLVNVVLWAPCAFYLLLRHQGINRQLTTDLLRFASIVTIAGLSLMLYNYLRFGDPAQSGYSSVESKFNLTHLNRDFVASFFTPQRGLFAFNPILLATLPAWIPLFRKKAKEGFLLLAICALWFPFMASWVSYQGGWAWANRLLTLIVPILVIPLGFLSLKALWQKLCVGSLLIISVYIQTVAVLQNTAEYFVILKDMETRPDARAQMPPQLFGNICLFHQKIAGHSGSYPVEAFGVKGGGNPVDTSRYETYQGFHLWFSHLARFSGFPMLHLLQIPLLAGIGILTMRTIRGLKEEEPGEARREDESGVMTRDYAEDRRKKKHLSFRYQCRARQAYWALRKFAPRDNPEILDLGCAEGLTMALLHRLADAKSSIGIEYTQGLIDSAGQLPDNCTIRQGDVTRLGDDLRNQSFHLVTALALLEHIDDPAKVFNQVRETLAPGGLFVATCPSPFWDKLSGSVGLHKDEYHFTEFRWSLFRDLCLQTGLEPVRYKPFMFVVYAFLPYLNIPVSAEFAQKLDHVLLALQVFRPTFVNQLFVARKPIN
jgi:SAM-dependent methyltransferase